MKKNARVIISLSLLALALSTTFDVLAERPASLAATAPAAHSRVRDGGEPPNLFRLLLRYGKKVGIIRSSEDLPIPPRP